MGDGIAAAGVQHELAQVANQTGAVVWGANNSAVNMAASHPLFGQPLRPLVGSLALPLVHHAAYFLGKAQARVAQDLYYIEHWSPWLDLKIPLKTVEILVCNDNCAVRSHCLTRNALRD